MKIYSFRTIRIDIDRNKGLSINLILIDTVCSEDFVIGTRFDFPNITIRFFLLFQINWLSKWVNTSFMTIRFGIVRIIRADIIV